VWGSSFLAAHIGVRDLPPLLFSAGRSLIAGILLLAVARYRGEALPRSARDWALMGFFALSMIVFSNGPAMHGLQHLPSNEVALLNASIALWIAGFGTLGPKGQPLRARSGIGLLLGFAGVALLVWRGGFRIDAHLGWQVLVLAGAVSWSIGTIVFRNSSLQVGPVAFNAALMLLGSAGLFCGGVLTGELPQWRWSTNGMWAMLYLAVFGSALAYTAYAWLIKNARTDRVATFAYVNPAIATVLGWVVLGESLAPPQVLGMFVILAGVALVTLPTRIA
ncbi:MAG TPA: EamA family transporter, partial [Steroidobacteraceae bacterium]|nr:EamA family transporter [Steroidobacteraceae bacterium]